MPKLRVVVVEDSLTVRERICEVLGSDPEIDLVGVAADGRRAIELCESLRPDVMTMDMMLPVMSGLAATEYVMAHCPTPILIVSSSMNRGEVFNTFEALAAGAVDILEKSGADLADGEWEAKLIAAVKLVARIRVITHPRARLPSFSAKPRPSPSGRRELLAIGASTGGPGALATILRALPAPFEIPILIVLHVAEAFSYGFAEWLGSQTAHRVALAAGGESLASLRGRVMMAPPGRHLIVQGQRLASSSAPERHSCRPSVDVLFESLAREQGDRVVAALLTGMGRDGAAGLLEIRRAGGATLAQDQETSVVYGMPREAALIGAAQHVLPLNEIGPTMIDLVRS